MTTVDSVVTGAPRIRFKRHQRVADVPGEAVYLVSERDVLTLEGDLVHLVAPHLDGAHDLDGLADRLAGDVAAERVFYLVERLASQGQLCADEPAAPPRPAAYWDMAGVDGEAATGPVRLVALGDVPVAEFATLLGRDGIQVAEDAPLSVVLCDHYLRPELRALNAEHLAAGRPWLLAKPVGSVIWVGPLFRPGATACWACLAQRYHNNRSAASYLEGRLGLAGPLLPPPADLAATREIGLRLAALETRKWLAGLRGDGQDDLFTLDTLTLTGTRHALRPRPQCPACGDAGLVAATVTRPVTLASRGKTHTADGGHRARGPDEVLRQLEHLVSPVTGVVTELARVDVGIDAVKGYTAGHNPAYAIPDLDVLRAGLRSGSAGKGMTDEQARASALCEAVERCSGVFQGDEPRVRATFAELGDDAVHPNACQLYSDGQYARRRQANAVGRTYTYVCEPLDEHARIDWTPVWSLTHGRHKHLPTSYLYYGYPHGRERIHAWADSNGNAAGASLEDAILQGMLELVERDSVALWWYNRLRRPAVDLDSFAEPWVDRLREVHARLRRDLWVLDLTTDLGVPAAAAVSRRNDRPVEDVLLGFGAHLDPRIAVLRALTELNQFLPAVIDTDRRGYASHDEHQLDWWRTATVAGHPYLLPDPSRPCRGRDAYATRSSPDLLDDLRTMQSLVEAAGMELLVLDQTRPDVGLPVVKVIIPGMRHFWTRFAPGRLYDVPVRLGWLDTPTREADLNPIAMFL